MSELVNDDTALIQSLHDEVVSLEEEVLFLRDENKRLRNNQRVARAVVRGLREKVEELIKIAEHNDAEFVSASNDIADEVVPEAVDGLSQADGYSGTTGLEL